MFSYIINCLFDYVTVSMVIIVTILYYYSTYTYDKWRKLNVPYLLPVPFFGNTFKMLMFLEHHIEMFDRIYQHFPEANICGFYQLKTPFLMIRNPELINRILKADFLYFTDHGIDVDPASNLLANSLFFMNGKKWRTLRQKLSPGFTSGKIKDTYDQIKECSQEMIRSIGEKSKQTLQIEVKEVTRDFATDVIGTCAFGLKLDNIKNHDSEFGKHTIKLFKGDFSQNIRNFLLVFFPKLSKCFKLQTFPQDCTDFFKSVFSDVIKYRTENHVVRNDLTQTLLQARKDLVLNWNSTVEIKDKYTETDIIGNAMLMFVAGAEPISSVLSFCLYELALNKDIQDKLRAEIHSKKEHDGQLTHNFLTDLHYADMVIEETNRKYSINIVLIREATETYTVPGNSLIIEKGQKIILPMHSIHHDPKYYPKPEIFDPERFTMEEKSKRPNGTYFPFGDGPRHCIAKRFAEMEMKLVLSEVLMKYEIKQCEQTDIPLQLKKSPGLSLTKNGIWLNFSPIID